jgi:hypothetical protein
LAAVVVDTPSAAAAVVPISCGGSGGVWIEVDSSSLVVLEPLRKTFPTLGTLYDPKPAVRGVNGAEIDL